MSSFKIFNDIVGKFTNKQISDIGDESQIINTARDISSASVLKLTFSEPTTNISINDLLRLLTGQIYSTIQDYTGGGKVGKLVLGITDTPTTAKQIFSKFQLSTGSQSTVIFIDRELSGGSTELQFGSFVGTNTNIKFTRTIGGIQQPDSDSTDLWTTNDDSTKGFYLYITGINFTKGSEQVRFTASQTPPPLQFPELCRYNSIATFDKLDFIQTLHPEFSLNAWCYFGRLVGNSNTYALTFLIQKTIPFTLPGIHHKLDFDIAGGFNNSTLQKWQLDGCGSSSGPIITASPWAVGATCDTGSLPADLTTLSVKNLTGTVGEPGATYRLRLEAIISLDFHVNPVYIDVDFTDVLGTVNEGFGPDAFLPNWLTPTQRSTILNNFGGSVENYLASGQDPLTGQGSYYFSQPLLQVTDFTIFDLQGSILDTKASGNNSVIWFDYVAQSFDAAGIDIVSNVGWEFFAIQFPDVQKSLMITKVTTQTSGEYLLANLFETGGVVTRWNINDIDIVGSNVWTSPTTSKQYYMTYTITLTNPAAILTINTEWDEQEISVGGQTKYEGICTVTGTLLGNPVIGFSWIEQQSLN